MKNYNKIILIGLMLLMGTGLLAQGPARDRIKTLKVAFITERLELTSSEAQDFWPVYNAHEEKQQKLRRRNRLQLGGQLAFLDELSEEEAAKLLSDYMALEEEKHQLRQNFVTDLKKVIPAKKIAKLFKAEEDFKKRLLQQVRKRRGGG